MRPSGSPAPPTPSLAVQKKKSSRDRSPPPPRPSPAEQAAAVRPLPSLPCSEVPSRCSAHLLSISRGSFSTCYHNLSVVAEAGLAGDEVHRGKLLLVAEHLAGGFATAGTKAKAVLCSEIPWHRRLGAHARTRSSRKSCARVSDKHDSRIGTAKAPREVQREREVPDAQDMTRDVLQRRQVPEGLSCNACPRVSAQIQNVSLSNDIATL